MTFKSALDRYLWHFCPQEPMVFDTNADWVWYVLVSFLSDEELRVVAVDAGRCAQELDEAGLRALHRDLRVKVFEQPARFRDVLVVTAELAPQAITAREGVEWDARPILTQVPRPRLARERAARTL
jgi:hypothetical protein